MQLIQLLTVLWVMIRIRAFKGMHLFANPYHLDAVWSPGRMVFRKSEAARNAVVNALTNNHIVKSIGNLLAANGAQIGVMVTLVEGQALINFYELHDREAEGSLFEFRNPFWRDDGRFVLRHGIGGTYRPEEEYEKIYYNPYTPLISYTLHLDEEYGQYFSRHCTAWA